MKIDKLLIAALAVASAGQAAAQDAGGLDEVTVTAVTSTRGVGDMRHDTTSYVHNPQHRWYYYPDMTRDEVIVFKAHDSQQSVARRVPHTAFTDPTCPPGTPTRASVEARGLVIFV